LLSCSDGGVDKGGVEVPQLAQRSLEAAAEAPERDRLLLNDLGINQVERGGGAMGRLALHRNG
jgi:hypothetical protein